MSCLDLVHSNQVVVSFYTWFNSNYSYCVINYLRGWVKHVDEYKTESHKKNNSCWNDIGGHEKGHLRCEIFLYLGVASQLKTKHYLKLYISPRTWSQTWQTAGKSRGWTDPRTFFSIWEISEMWTLLKMLSDMWHSILRNCDNQSKVWNLCKIVLFGQHHDEIRKCDKFSEMKNRDIWSIKAGGYWWTFSEMDGWWILRHLDNCISKPYTE